MKLYPTISVIMPVYNTEKYVKESVDSILNQTFNDFELIIIDDCSSDGTVKVLESYSDSRIKLIQNTENLGLTKNLNKALDIAKGEFIARMDADDISLPTRFEKQVKAFRSNNALGICGTWFENFGDILGTTRYAITHEEIAFGLLYQSQFCHPSVMMRKSVLDEFQLRYDETFTTAQDYELWSRIIFKTQASNLPEVLLKYRFHSQSISSTKKEQQLNNRNTIITNIFNSLEVIFEEIEVELFVSFCNASFEFTNSELKRIMNISEELSKSIRFEKICNNSWFNSMIAEKWYHLTYNSKNKLTFDLFKQASFYNELNVSSKVKLMIKKMMK
jgi:glycosyltransferase involved in cell wall biosynthesis